MILTTCFPSAPDDTKRRFRQQNRAQKQVLQEVLESRDESPPAVSGVNDTGEPEE